jgi:hypothetical protein
MAATVRGTATFLALILALPLLGAGDPPAKPPAPSPPGIRILSEVALPKELLPAQDVRWASDDSVYLALVWQGVAEFSLKPQGKVREVIPGAAKLGGMRLATLLAASPQYLAAAGPAYSVTWQKRESTTRLEEAFDSVKALDLRGARLLAVGARRGEKASFAPDGAVAWVGSLDKKLADLKPVLYDQAGPGAPNLDACGTSSLGAARFLPDGGFVLVPGFQPGVSRYSADGKLVQTWDTGALGIDSLRHDWVNRRTIVDAMLPLAQGPALVLRRVEKGRSRWDLVVLREGGPIERTPIPIESASDLVHLKADVRGAKIDFLLHEFRPRDLHFTQTRLFLADLAPAARGRD